MPTEDIPTGDWEAFLQGFSLQHQGWLATIEVFGPEIGAQVESQDLPLQGISADLKGPEKTILIIVGKAPLESVSHAVRAPTKIRIKRNETGADEALEIESAESTTLLRFRSAVPVEAVDGIL